MTDFRPRLMDTTDPISRMDALCEFIDFWLGPWRPEYGESADVLSAYSLPMPLRRIYEYAGCWPSLTEPAESAWAVGAFSAQDALRPLGKLESRPDGKLVFLVENQGVWDCRTLQHGDDPPVWCFGDHVDENRNWFTGEKLVCDSLSSFLVTFALQEMAFGSRLYLCDEGLTAMFESQRDAAVPVWLDGPYVHGSDYNYFLWNDVLVARIGGLDCLSANHPNSITFLTESQGPIYEIQLMVGHSWTLDIRADGSARLRFFSGQADESAEARPNTFGFAKLLESLGSAVSDEGHYDRNPMVFLRRQGQSGAMQGKHLHAGELVTYLFRLSLERAVEPNKVLERRFHTDWPL